MGGGTTGGAELLSDETAEEVAKLSETARHELEEKKLAVRGRRRRYGMHRLPGGRLLRARCIRLLDVPACQLPQCHRRHLTERVHRMPRRLSMRPRLHGAHAVRARHVQ